MHCGGPAQPSWETQQLPLEAGERRDISQAMWEHAGWGATIPQHRMGPPPGDRTCPRWLGTGAAVGPRHFSGLLARLHTQRPKLVGPHQEAPAALGPQHRDPAGPGTLA